jgi:hypothetical protein
MGPCDLVCARALKFIETALAVSSGLTLISSENIPTLRSRSPENGRTSKDRGGGPTPCSPRRVRNEQESGSRAAFFSPLAFGPLLCFGAPRLTPPRRDPQVRPPIGTPPSPRGHGSAPPQIRARLPRCATALVRPVEKD